MDRLIPKIIESQELHVRWLNTLSYLENCGARKIAATEHRTLVQEKTLKHAAEEFRHAFILKKQMSRIGNPLPTYEKRYLLGGFATLRYLDKLEVQISRFLKRNRLSPSMLYLLVTYAIEKRAEALYPLYETHLRRANLPVSVKSIYLEEQGHLREIEDALAEYPEGFAMATKAVEFEKEIYQKWFLAIQNEAAFVI